MKGLSTTVIIVAVIAIVIGIFIFSSSRYKQPISTTTTTIPTTTTIVLVISSIPIPSAIKPVITISTRSGSTGMVVCPENSPCFINRNCTSLLTEKCSSDVDCCAGNCFNNQCLPKEIKEFCGWPTQKVTNITEQLIQEYNINKKYSVYEIMCLPQIGTVAEYFFLNSSVSEISELGKIVSLNVWDLTDVSSYILLAPINNKNDALKYVDFMRRYGDGWGLDLKKWVVNITTINDCLKGNCNIVIGNNCTLMTSSPINDTITLEEKIPITSPNGSKEISAFLVEELVARRGGIDYEKYTVFSSGYFEKSILEILKCEPSIIFSK